jgi:hypothetical protein
MRVYLQAARIRSRTCQASDWSDNHDLGHFGPLDLSVQVRFANLLWYL